MYDTILVPTDGSDAAETAAEGAIALARRFDASIHAVFVLELGDLPGDVYRDAVGELSTHGEGALATIAERAADADVAATTHVIETTDSVHDEVVEYADEHDADLVVMGTHGRTGLGRFVLGSVAERTLRVSPVPVLTVHEDAAVDPDFPTVLVPTDGSDPADAAAAHAIGLAGVVGAALHVVHVVDLSAAWGDYGTAAVLEALEEAGQRAVDDVVARADAAGLDRVQASVLSGTPARAIVDYADEHDVDLIVLGTHGRTGLDRYLLGSVTERVVRRATVPVLTVPTAGDR